MSSNPVADNFLAYSANRLRGLAGTIDRCVGQLSEEQIWHRDGDHENAVGNLLLHLEGNMRQWVLHGVDGQPDVRQRDEEFALMTGIDSAEARLRFRNTLEESVRVIAGLDCERLLVVIDPQPDGTWRHATILEAISKIVGHVEMHAGQIILLTKQFAGKDLDLSIPRKR
jgi:hypothetical protein